jgi:FtsH-binding integral membrane protein
MQTPVIVKAVIVIALLAIVASLALALWRLQRGGSRSSGTVKALTLRVALSVGLFLLVILGIVTGIIVPHGISP